MAATQTADPLTEALGQIDAKARKDQTASERQRQRWLKTYRQGLRGMGKSDEIAEAVRGLGYDHARVQQDRELIAELDEATRLANDLTAAQREFKAAVDHRDGVYKRHLEESREAGERCFLAETRHRNAIDAETRLHELRSTHPHLFEPEGDADG